MSDSILIGARGWDHPGWHGGFYPEELPADWRLTYYNNLLRAVLVPAETWEEVGDGELRQWAEDTDAGFRFVLELPAALSRPQPLRALTAPLTGFFRAVAPIHALTAGLLVAVPPDAVPEASWLDGLLAELGPARPVCVDLPPAWRTPHALRVLARHAAGLCWHADDEPAPVAGGRLLVALSAQEQPRAQRAILEKLAAWRRNEARAGLFLTGPNAAEQAGKTRLIAEMMGV
jgi:uncharacterized protein YecE (DUF72 family)